VSSEDEDNRSNDDAKNPEEGIDCELATTEFFTLSIWSGTQFMCWPSVNVERSIAIFDRSGRALAKSAVSRLRSENREGNAEHSTPTNTEHQNRTSNAGV